MKKAKLEMETLGKMLLLTAFLIVFLLMFKGCKDQMENVGTVGWNEYVCWFSHALKGKITFLFPSGCYPIDIEKEQDKQGISVLMRKCWWMHGQGEDDIPTAETTIGAGAVKVISWYDIARTCYIFIPKEDINLQELGTYLRDYDKSGKKLDKKERDTKKTTWGYIQKVSSDKTGICFGEDIEGTLIKGRAYYIIFYDDRGPLSKGVRDRIMISRDPEFGEGQTGIIAYIKEHFTSLGCRDWRKEAQEEVTEGVNEALAMKLFENLMTYLKECSKVTGNERCYCGSNLEILPGGYAIKIEMIEDKKYQVSLLQKGNLFEKDGKKFVGEISGRLGIWSLGGTPCYPWIIGKDRQIRNPHISSSINQYVIFEPNSHLTGCKENYGVYLISESLMAPMGIKECKQA